MRRLGDFILVINDVLDAEFCADLIQEFEQIDIGDTKRVSQDMWDVHYRRFTELNIPMQATRSRKFADINEQLIRRQGELYEQYRQWTNSTFLVPFELAGVETARIQKFSNNDVDQFGWHADVGDALTSRRSLVMQTFLNDDFTGGEKLFSGIIPDGDLRCTPKTGTTIIYPASFMFPNMDTLVTDGPKYVLTQYTHYV